MLSGFKTFSVGLALALVPQAVSFVNGCGPDTEAAIVKALSG